MKGTADEVKQAAKEQASAVLQEAKETASAKLDEQRRGAASTLGDLAAALRKAARELDGERQGAARVTEWAANGLQRASSTLGSKDLPAIVREVETFARTQPVAFIAGAVAAGFLATRFLKSSSEPDQSSGAQNTDPSRTTRI